MADPFELWRLVWSTAATQGFEWFAEAVPRGRLRPRPRRADALDFSTFPLLGRVRIELATMWLLEPREPARSEGPPTLIVAPFAVHNASIADFADRHSLAQSLAAGGAGSIALTFWKSATADMRDYGIDSYLSDLNVAIDDLGGRVSLVGLCQGGWFAALYASRFPEKVVKLVLAGAPIDVAAAESSITRALAALSPATIEQIIEMGGGRVFGPLALAVWSQGMEQEYNAEDALQCQGDAALIAKFDAWNARTVDLPGVYFIQTAEWLFRENRLARDCFPALGRLPHLSKIDRPIFVLAGAEDEVVPAPQVLAVKSLCRDANVAVRVEQGRHLSLFMGRRTLEGAWREIARWLEEGDAGALPRAPAGPRRLS